MAAFGSDFIYPHNRKEELAQILDKRADQLIRKTAGICLALGVASVLYVIYPFYLFVRDGTRPMPVPIIMPFIDPDTDLGYSLCILNQAILSVSGIFGNYCIEILFSLIINNLWAAFDIIDYALETLPIKVHSVQEKINRKRLIRNILIQIQDVDRYNSFPTNISFFFVITKAYFL